MRKILRCVLRHFFKDTCMQFLILPNYFPPPAGHKTLEPRQKKKRVTPSERNSMDSSKQEKVPVQTSRTHQTLAKLKRLLVIKEQQQDLRSLATFRILLGLYIFYDICARLQHGRLSLLWYTSSAPLSFLRPDDTPHKSPVHLIWFYRGSEVFQLFLFALTGVLAILYSVGYSSISFPRKRGGGKGNPKKSNNKDDHNDYSDYDSPSSSKSSSFALLSVFLWFNVAAMQCRNMYVHDGSDVFARHLLLWSCFLPMNQVWSLDAYLLRKKWSNEHSQKDQKGKEGKNKKIEQNGQELLDDHLLSPKIQNKIAVWGIRLQIVFMYLGTVLARTTDLYGYSLNQLSRSEWLPPSLTAVYYSLSSSFSTRDCFLGDFIRNHFQLTRIMTLSAMIIEGLAPIASLIMGINYDSNASTNPNSNLNRKKKIAYLLPPLLLFKLHFGLLLLMNLPNWQFVAMIATTIWIPTFAWDDFQRQLSMWYPIWFAPPVILQTPLIRQKKDMEQIEVYASPSGHTKPKTRMKNNDDLNYKSDSKQPRFKMITTYFFFFYMIYNFAGQHGWIAKHDNGDIGELLRFSQYWVMFSMPPKSSTHGVFTAKVLRRNQFGIDEMVDVDVWRWMKDSEIIELDINTRREQIWTNMTHVYPSPRLERLFDQWSSHKNYGAMKYFLDKVCRFSPFSHLTYTMQHLAVNGPLLKERHRKSREDTTFRVDCKNEH